MTNYPMDEARLKEIEQSDFAASNGIYAAEHRELIAAVRAAWAKRDKLEKLARQRTEEFRVQRDRAVAEVKRLTDDLVHKDAVITGLQQQYVDHMKPLQAVREAAEAYLNLENSSTPGVTLILKMHPAYMNLRRTLSALKESP